MRIKDNEGKIIYPELSYEITGMLFEVHNELGNYCREKQYCDALEKLLIEKGMFYEKEVIVETESEYIKNNSNRIDFIIEDQIILEVKAKRGFVREDYNQIKRYLRFSNKKLGLLINFHQKYLIPKRVINSYAKE